MPVFETQFQQWLKSRPVGTQSVSFNFPSTYQELGQMKETVATSFHQSFKKKILPNLKSHQLNIQHSFNLNAIEQTDVTVLNAKNLSSKEEGIFLAELQDRLWRQPTFLDRHLVFIYTNLVSHELLQQRLLKLLEEESSSLLFLWVGIPTHHFLPTIKSRTLQWRLSHQQLEDFLDTPLKELSGQTDGLNDKMDKLMPRERLLHWRQQLLQTPFNQWADLLKSWQLTDKDLLLLVYDLSGDSFHHVKMWEKWQEFHQWYQQSLQWNNPSKERHFFLQQFFPRPPL